MHDSSPNSRRHSHPVTPISDNNETGMLTENNNAAVLSIL